MNRHVVTYLARKDEAARRLKTAARTLRAFIGIALAATATTTYLVYLTFAVHGGFAIPAIFTAAAAVACVLFSFVYSEEELDKRRDHFFEQKLQYELAVLEAAK